MRIKRVFILLLGSFSAVPCVLSAEPFIPEHDTQILERLPYRITDPRVRELRRLRAELTGEPGNLELGLNLARRYIELGRAESDPRYYGYAQAALRPWWDLSQPPPDVLVLRAILRQKRHQFAAALEDLSDALALEPRNAQAWLSRAVILQVQGDYSAALRNCMPLLGLRESLLAVICISSATSMIGQASKHYELLNRTLASTPSIDDETQRWALVVLAEIAYRLGNYQTAEKHFRLALALKEPDAYLLGAYTDLLLEQGRATEVVALLKDKTRIDGLLLRLAMAEKQLGLPTYAHVASLKARFAASRLRGDRVHLGEEARFALHLLDDPQTALKLALSSWEVQREPRDARIVLEAALAAREPAAAKPVLEMLEHTSLEDVRLSALAARLKTVRR